MKNKNVSVKEILGKWEDICAQRNYAKNGKMELAVFIGALGEAYSLLLGERSKEEKDRFIEEVLREEKVQSALQGIENREFIVTCIQAGMYKNDFIQSINPIYTDTTITKERKEEKIYKEFIFQNSEDVSNLVKILGLSFVLGQTMEHVIEKIEIYSEELEDTCDFWSEDAYDAYDDEDT